MLPPVALAGEDGHSLAVHGVGLPALHSRLDDVLANAMIAVPSVLPNQT
jgi:hypothetical protein